MARTTKTLRVTDWSTAYACQAFKLCSYLAGALTVTPLQRILEGNICRNYYREHDTGVIPIDDHVPEELCKIGPVQSRVLDINGFSSALDILPSLLAALVYLRIQQKISKKSMLILNASGFFLMNLYYVAILYFYNVFDVRWIYLTCVFNFVGGGAPTFQSLIPALIAESIPQNLLSTFQLNAYAISLLVRIAGTSTSLFIMRSKSLLWLPVILGLCIHCLTIPLTMVCFKGPLLGFSRTNASLYPTSGSYTHLKDDDDDIELSSQPDLENSPPGTDLFPVAGMSSWKSIKQIYPIFRRYLSPGVILPFHDFGYSLRFILPYWMSRRYHWELREVGWVHLCDNLFTAMVLMLMPRFGKAFLWQPTVSTVTPAHAMMAPASHIVEQEDDDSEPQEIDSNVEEAHQPHTCAAINATNTSMDFALSQFCLLFSMIGALLLSLSWYRFSALVSLAVMAGGVGFQETYYSYLAGQVAADGVVDLSSLYMVLSMISMVAILAGGWMVSSVYSISLRLGGESWATSTPIWFCAGAYGISWCILSRCKP